MSGRFEAAVGFVHQHDGDVAALIFHICCVLSPFFPRALTYFAHEDHYSSGLSFTPAPSLYR